MDIILSVTLLCCSQFSLKILLVSQEEVQNSWSLKMIMLSIFGDELVMPY